MGHLFLRKTLEGTCRLRTSTARHNVVVVAEKNVRGSVKLQETLDVKDMLKNKWLFTLPNNTVKMLIQVSIGLKKDII